MPRQPGVSPLARGRLSALVVLPLAMAAHAQAPAPATAVASPATPASAAAQRVEIQGGGGQDLRRAAVGAMVVVSREELRQYGDTRLADALRRVPGLSVVNNGPRGVELRMSGLGGGYTQILLNGEPVPPGFALDSLSPDMVERVEIARSASAEQSSQAIAGSINIVLRRASAAVQRELKLGLGSRLGRPRASADLQLGGREAGMDWGLGLGLAADRSAYPFRLAQRVLDGTGQTTQAYTTDKHEVYDDCSLTLTPRASWKFGDAQQIGSDHLLRLYSTRGLARDRRNSAQGPLPTYESNDLHLDTRGYLLRSRVNWTHSDSDGAKWELKLGYTRQQRIIDADFDGFDFAGTWIRDAHVDSRAVDQGLSLSGRLRQPWRDTHALSLGWDTEINQRDEDRIQREQALPGGLPVENLDEIYRAQVRRLAWLVQDEWAFHANGTATLGLRWEGLQTVSDGNVFTGVKRRSGVFSPVLQTLWRLPPGQGQLRFALARSYKAPTPRELTPRRFVANNNSPTTPDLQGNPDLRPELAWGLDAGWEVPFGKAGQVNLGVYVKRISDVIVDELFQQNGVWVERRANNGVAWARGIEVDGRLALRNLWPAAPAMALRASLGLNRSRLKAVPGPDNRLAQQTPLVLNLGMDHTIDGLPWSWGANLNVQTAGHQRLSANTFADKASTRTLDLVLSWKPGPGRQLRLSLNNLAQSAVVSSKRVLDGANENLFEERLRTGPAVRLSWEQAL